MDKDLRKFKDNLYAVIMLKEDDEENVFSDEANRNEKIEVMVKTKDTSRELTTIYIIDRLPKQWVMNNIYAELATTCEMCGWNFKEIVEEWIETYYKEEGEPSND